MEIAIADATVGQMRAFMKTAATGLEPGPNTGAEALRRILGDAGYEAIHIDENGLAVKAPAARRPDTVTVLLARSSELGGERPVPVAVNGKLMLIPRGAPVAIPCRYFEALKNATTTKYRQELDDNGRPDEMKAVDVPTFPFQIIPDGAAA